VKRLVRLKALRHSQVDDKEMFTNPSRLNEAQVVIINDWQQVKSNFEVIKQELERL